MQMQMIDRLSGIGAAIDRDAKPAVEMKLLGELANSEQQMARRQTGEGRSLWLLSRFGLIIPRASFACCPGARFHGGEDHASRRTVVNTLKSAALLIVLLVVLYAVYVALNKPDPPEHAGAVPGESGSPLIEYN